MIKRHIFVLIILLSGVWGLKAQTAEADKFITVWETKEEAGKHVINFPGVGSNFTVEWEEVGNETANHGTHTDSSSLSDPAKLDYFPTAGKYRIKISPGSGTFTGFATGSYKFHDHKKLLKVEQWGTIPWTHLEKAFFAASNLDITATDVPDLSRLTSLAYMFSGCFTLIYNSSINNWDTSNIKNMFAMFESASIFNQPIGNWNTSNVTNMSFMFSSAYAFNQPIGGWNTSKVTNMANMFHDARVFNQPIGNWNTSKVTNMSFMFQGASTFNQPIGNWDTSKVTNMNAMFNSASAFNQPIGGWNVSKVANMRGMFAYAKSFNQPIGGWDTSKVANMSRMFGGAVKFNQPIGSWNISNVTNLGAMFNAAFAFNQPIGNWDTHNVTNIGDMFHYAYAFNQPLNDWNTSKVTNMRSVFHHAHSFNQPLDKWDTSKVKDMLMMFREAFKFNRNIGMWNISSLTNAQQMLYDNGISSDVYDEILIGWASQGDNIPLNIGMRTRRPKYCLAEEARQYLIDKKEWNIIDKGKDCTTVPPKVTLGQPDKVTVTLSAHAPTACLGKGIEVTVNITGGTPPYTLVYPGATTSLSNTGTAENPTGSHTFTFDTTGTTASSVVFDGSNVRISDSKDCTPESVAPITVTINPTPGVFTLDGTTVCNGGTAYLTLENSEVGVNYQIQTLDGANIGGVVAGTGSELKLPITGGTDITATTQVQVEATGSGGCGILMKAPVRVLYVGDFKTDYTFDPAGTCINNTATIRMRGSQVGVNYQLQTEAGENVGGAVLGNGSAIYFNTGSLTAATTYKVKAFVNGATGCETELTNKITVEVYALPTFEVELSDVKCFSESTGSLKVIPKTGEAPYTYELMNLDTFETITVENQSGEYTFEGLKAGTYSVRMTDGKGCLKTD